MNRLLLSIGAVLLLSLTAAAGPILYGGNGGHGPNPIAPSVNDGWLVLVDQTTGAITPIGHPDSVARLSGLAFDLTGALWATTLSGGGFPPPPAVSILSSLIQINPATGAQLSSVPVTAGGSPIAIADLAVQPGTDTLYGISSSVSNGGPPGVLYTLNRTTGVATPVNPAMATHFFNSIAFAPNGTLYEIAADLDNNDNVVNPQLLVLNPVNGASTLVGSLSQYYGALAVRPTDGILFAGNGDGGQIVTIDPATRAETLLNKTPNTQFPGDLAFAPIPEPGTIALVGLGWTALLLLRKRRTDC